MTSKPTAALIAALLAVAAVPAGAQGLIDELAGNKPAGAAAKGGIRQAIPMGQLQKAWDTRCDASKQATAGVKVVSHARNRVFCIDVRQNMPVTVFFPEWEDVVQFTNGDPSAFTVTNAPAKELSRKTLRIEATELANVDTNLIVVGRATGGDGAKGRWSVASGGRNVYTFILRSYPVDAATITDQVVFVEASLSGGAVNLDDVRTAQMAVEIDAGTTKPGGAGAASVVVAEADATDYLREVPFNMAKMRFDSYSVQVSNDLSYSIAPVRVFTDGTFTWLDFGESGRADRIQKPVLFRVVDGIDNPANYNWTGPEENIMVVHHVGDFTLRNGDRVVCVRFRRELPPPPDVVKATRKESTTDAPTSSPRPASGAGDRG